MRKTRLMPLRESEWPDEARDVLARNRLGVSRAGVPNVLATLARHPRLLKQWYPFAGFLLAESKLPPRDRELLILRTAWLCQSEYEWGQHVVLGRRAGLDDEEIARVRRGAEAPGWDAFEATLLRAADELRQDSSLGDATWAGLGERYGDQQRIEVVFLVGQYNLVAMLLNTLGVELDEGTEGLETPPGN